MSCRCGFHLPFVIGVHQPAIAVDLALGLAQLPLRHCLAHLSLGEIVECVQKPLVKGLQLRRDDLDEWRSLRIRAVIEVSPSFVGLAGFLPFASEFSTHAANVLICAYEFESEPNAIS